MRVRLFAGLRERAGASSLDVDLADGAVVGDVWPALGLGDEPGAHDARLDIGPAQADDAPARVVAALLGFAAPSAVTIVHARVESNFNAAEPVPCGGPSAMVRAALGDAPSGAAPAPTSPWRVRRSGW